MPKPLFNLTPQRSAAFGRIDIPFEPWLARQAPEVAIDPLLPIVDPHHHLWDYPGYRYLVPELEQDVAGGHNVVATIYAECVSMYRQTGPHALRPVGEVEFAVGQAAQSAADLRAPLAIGAGIIGWADLKLGDGVAAVLDALAEASGDRLVGTRFSTSWDAAPEIVGSPHDDRPHVLRERAVRAGLATLAHRGLVFDSWSFFHQLDELAEVADALPDLTIVMDHCGGPLGYGPYAADRKRWYDVWAQKVRAVAQRPNVHCKLGGLLARGAAFDYLHADRPPTSAELAELWRPWIEPCIEWFGVERCMFESNFPLEKMGTGYTVLWNCFKRLARHASDAERFALFAGNADRIYGLGLLHRD